MTDHLTVRQWLDLQGEELTFSPSAGTAWIAGALTGYLVPVGIPAMSAAFTGFACYLVLHARRLVAGRSRRVSVL